MPKPLGTLPGKNRVLCETNRLVLAYTCIHACERGSVCTHAHSNSCPARYGKPQSGLSLQIRLLRESPIKKKYQKVQFCILDLTTVGTAAPLLGSVAQIPAFVYNPACGRHIITS